MNPADLPDPETSERVVTDVQECPRCRGKPCPACGGSRVRQPGILDMFETDWVLPICTWCLGDPCPDCGGVAGFGTVD